MIFGTNSCHTGSAKNVSNFETTFLNIYRSLNESNKTRRVSNSGTIKDRRDIIKNIANDVLNKNLNLQFKFFYNELEDFLMNKNVDTWYASGTNEETTLKIIQSSVDLERKIRTLNISPKIITIRNISDVFW